MIKKISYGASFFFLLSFCLAACDNNGAGLISNKLVVAGNQQSIPMYTDEQSYLKVSGMKQQGGVEGMAGQVANGMEAKSVEPDTPVKVISKDDNGAQVEIIAGPLKGQTGFVPAQNVS
jgi:transcription antitermination factor NusG